jgi:DNA polymerase-4
VDVSVPLQAPPPNAHRRILLVDCDAFFVQVARLEDPEGAGAHPLLIVGGTPEGRGVVTSASYEARRFGVHSAMSTAEAIRLCPDAFVAPVPREACLSKSRAIMQALQVISPIVSPASIDEYYLDFSGTERMLHGEPLEATARRIQQHVLEESSIQVSIGGATNRTIAKMAAGRAKPAGVRIVAPGEEAAFMRELALSDIQGVGPAFTAELAGHGLVTVEDALRVGDKWLLEWFGKGRGGWLARIIRGIDTHTVMPHETRRSLSSENTFGRNLVEDHDIERELLRLSCSVAAALRGEGLRARTVTIKLRDPDFTTRQASRTLREAIESDQAVFNVARTLLEGLRHPRPSGAGTRRPDPRPTACIRQAVPGAGTPVRLLGVQLSGFVERDVPRQLVLFEEGESERERDRKLARVSDDLRERFGSDGVLPARLLERREKRGEETD